MHTAPAQATALVHWTDAQGLPQQAPWRSTAGRAPPAALVLADETLGADAAYRLLAAGTAVLWLGDYLNARQLLQALGRRIDRRQRRPGKPAASLTAAFHAQRQAQAERARILGGLLLPSTPTTRCRCAARPMFAPPGPAHGPVASHYASAARTAGHGGCL
jgi:hypothetical protein